MWPGRLRAATNDGRNETSVLECGGEAEVEVRVGDRSKRQPRLGRVGEVRADIGEVNKRHGRDRCRAQSAGTPLSNK